MASFFHDGLHGVRLLAKRPGFTLLILLVLVPGIAVNLAVFTFVKAVIFESLPFPNAERLTTVFGTLESETTELRGLSYLDYLDWAEQSESIDVLAVGTSSPMNLSDGDTVERVMVEFTTPGYFDVLGVGARQGRLFTEEDNQLPRGAMIAAISDELWRTTFGGESDFIGRSIRLDGHELVVIGIASEGFRGFEDDVQIWVPLTTATVLLPNRPPEIFEQRGVRWLQGFARLSPGIELSEAQEEVTTIGRRLQENYPETNQDRSAVLRELDDYVLGDLRPTLRMLWVIAGLVLLIVIANALNLLLVRMIDRHKEIAVRAALGAGPVRISRQMLAENLALGLVAGGLGTLLGALLVRITAGLNPISLPGYTVPKIDLGVLGFALLLSLLLGALLGFLPALQARRLDLSQVLSQANASAVGGGRRVLFNPRHWLFVGEVAISVMVLIGASLVYQSFEKQRSIDPGFETERVVAARLELPAERKLGPAAIGFTRGLTEEAAALPGVSEIGIASDLPMDGGYSAIVLQVEDRLAEEPEHRMRVFRHHVSPGFFDALRIPLIRGEIFKKDGSENEGELDVVVSKKMAELAWPDRSPLGEILLLGPARLRVVGVVGDVRYRNLVPSFEGAPEDPDLYIPLFEMPAPRLVLLARTEMEPEALVSTLRDMVRDLEPGTSIHGVVTMGQVLKAQTSVARVASLLFGLLGGLALLFTSSGLYAVISYSVSRRTTEIGLRKALGANRRHVLTGVVAEGVKLFGIGLVLGIALAFVFHRVLASLLYGVSGTDLVTYLGVAVFLLAVAVLSCLVPAFRAAKLDPASALKVE